MAQQQATRRTGGEVRVTAMAVLAAAGLAVPALAQDSVGTTLKDNIGVYDAAQVNKRYVLDLVTVASSAGNNFAVGPLLKSGDASNGSVVTSAFVNANGIANASINSTIAAGTSFSTWQGGPGLSPGVNTARNTGTLGTATLPSGTLQLAAMFIENNSGGATGNANYGGVGGAVFNYDPNNTTRLYVSRTTVAQNNTAAGASSAAFGAGGVDANGNVHLRVDGFGASGANAIPSNNNNYLRVNILNRTNTVNWVRGTLNAGVINPAVALASQTGTDVARGVVDINTLGLTTVNTPNIIPESVAGRPILLGSAFDTNNRYESAPATLSATTAHRDNASNPTTDHRGNLAYTFRNFFPQSVNGTAAMLVFQVNGFYTRIQGNAIAISAWGLAADGAPTSNYIFSTPRADQGLGMSDPYTTVADPVLGNRAFQTNLDYPLVPGGDPLAFPPPQLPQFMNYQGNTAFQGGSGQAAVTVDPQGRLMVAGTMSANATAGLEVTRSDRRNFIAVGRINNANQASPDWVVAAWVSAPSGETDPNASSGKAILDANGNQVGRLTTFSDYLNRFPAVGTPPVVTQGGPSMSSPAFDANGNIYFIAPAVINTQTGTIKRLALIKGVRQDNPFGYRLELILREDQVIRGANSGLNYRISGLKLVNPNSTANVVDLGTVWANSSTHKPAGGLDPSTLATSDARNLGGIVFGASITYDVNDNGSFADAVDQNYQVLLFVNGQASAPTCRADYNGDTVLNTDDISDYITDYFTVPQVAGPGGYAQPCPGAPAPFDTLGYKADFNSDCVVNTDDISDFITAYFQGC